MKERIMNKGSNLIYMIQIVLALSIDLLLFFLLRKPSSPGERKSL